MTEVKCPYCGKEQEEPEEPEEAYTEDELYMTDCIDCGKTFGVTPYYIKGYHEYEMPCQNGEPHKWKKIHGHPEYIFKDKFRCEYCEEETTKDKIKDAKIF